MTGTVVQLGDFLQRRGDRPRPAPAEMPATAELLAFSPMLEPRASQALVPYIQKPVATSLQVLPPVYGTDSFLFRQPSFEASITVNGKPVPVLREFNGERRECVNRIIDHLQTLCGLDRTASTREKLVEMMNWLRGYRTTF